MYYIISAVCIWCICWWIYSFCQIYRDTPRYLNELIKENPSYTILPAWFVSVLVAIVSIVYIILGPILQPKWWVEKELSKRRIRRLGEDIKQKLGDHPELNHPDLVEAIDDVIQKSCKMKDCDW